MTDDTLLPKTPTSLSSWVMLVAKAIEGYGLDAQSIFEEAGIALEALKQPHGRIPTASMHSIWNIARELSGDPYIGINVAKYFQPSVFSALGMAMAASHHVFDAIQRAQRYSQMVSDASTTQLIEDEQYVSFLIKSRPPYTSPPNMYAIEGLLASMIVALRSISGDTFSPYCIEFQHDFDGNKAPFENFFGCPVHFSREQNKIVFDKKNIFTEHSFANSTLTCTLDNWIEEHLSNFKEDLISTKVQKYILKNLAYGEITQNILAKELALSPRMLQRKLKEENTSYSQLLDDCRHKLSLELITQNKLAISEITYILGFSDQSNFSRAFKRWTGISPNQYQKR